MKVDPLGIPLGTRLIHIDREINMFGHVRWRCWTALNSPNLDARNRRGTFIELHDDGYAVCITDDAPDFNAVTVMEGIK